ncbi:MAG: oligopeptide/dipeptide ABC transporter ATP-binding protein [Alphaproteobacteria bacterium]
MSPPLLSVRNLSVAFPIGGGAPWRPRRSLVAVDDVSFELGAGETLAVVGESGCGKSTLGRAILRLLEPTTGHVVWLGEDLGLLDPEGLRAKRRDLQIIFQDPLAALDPRMTVGDIVAEPLVAFDPSMARAARRARVEDALMLVGLGPEMINRYPHEFSGGQCQRIGIARAMVLKPRLIVCDEPVSALDASIQAQIVNLLQRLQRDFGLALLFISHNLSVVRHISQRVLVLYLGRVAELAPTQALFARPRHPYTRALIAAVPVPDPAVERAKPRLVLGGEVPSPLAPPSGCAFRTRCPIARPSCAAARPALEPAGADHLVACPHWREPTG